MLDFFIVNINCREYVKIFAYDIGQVIRELLSTGWSLYHVINIEYEGTGFSLKALIEKGFTEKRNFSSLHV